MINLSEIFSPVINFGLSTLARSRLPVVDGELKLEGLKAEADVYRDKWGVPHIFAQQMPDLFFAQGFIHAQDRLWQMEFNRRMVAGRLSEVLGEVTIPVDRWLRTLTMRRVAEYEVALLNEKTRAYLQAYADGINAFIKNSKLPVEFALLRYKPEPWIIADTLAWGKMMAWSLSVNWELEILRAQLIARLGPELAEKLEGSHPERWPYVVPPDTDYSNIGDFSLDQARAARPFSGPSPYQGLGSNNWVISGQHTTTGMPLLANDMHLMLSAPAIWYENHLMVNDLNITGVTFPGIPGILSGHNGHVAWGYTNGFPDVQDLYMERLRRSPHGEIQAEYNGEWEKVKVIREIIKVKGLDEEIIEEVVITRHGPVINILSPVNIGEPPVALRWTALEPDTLIQGMLEMLSAKNCRDFHNSLRQWTTPVQNVVYADTGGNIAYTYPGKIPIRAKGDGRLPVPGWTDEYEWIGYIPFEALPHLFNPPQGYIASANNRTFSEEYPVPIKIEPINGDRAQRIVELISERIKGGKKISSEYIQKMHFDQFSHSAYIIAQILGQIQLENHTPDQGVQEEIKPILDKFRVWDGNLTSVSCEAAIYQSFVRNLVLQIVNPLITKSKGAYLDADKAINLVNRFMGLGPTPVIQDLSISGDRWLSWIIQMLTSSDPGLVNLESEPQKEKLMLRVLQETVHDLKTMLGPNPANWAWGKLHQLTYGHFLGNNSTLAKFFNRGPYPIGGDQTTIWATTSNYHDLKSPSVIGPPYRMIVDLGQLENSISLLSPGQSGNPVSDHYDDQIKAWENGAYHPMLYHLSEIKQSSKHFLKLLPQ